MSNQPKPHPNNNRQLSQITTNGNNNKTTQILNQRTGIAAAGISIIIGGIAWFFNPEFRQSIHNFQEAHSPAAFVGGASSNQLPHNSWIESELSELENILVSQDFISADRKTVEILTRLAEHPGEDYLTTDELELIPCTYFRRIDQAWRRNSRGKFGFWAQNEVATQYITNESLTGPERWVKTLTAYGWEGENYEAYPENIELDSLPKGAFPRWFRLKEPSDTNWHIFRKVGQCTKS